jgi:hypothetical protein
VQQNAKPQRFKLLAASRQAGLRDSSFTALHSIKFGGPARFRNGEYFRQRFLRASPNP